MNIALDLDKSEHQVVAESPEALGVDAPQTFQSRVKSSSSSKEMVM